MLKHSAAVRSVLIRSPRALENPVLSVFFQPAHAPNESLEETERGGSFGALKDEKRNPPVTVARSDGRLLPVT